MIDNELDRKAVTKILLQKPDNLNVWFNNNFIGCSYVKIEL